VIFSKLGPFAKYAANTSWLMSDQILAVLFNLGVTAIVARYLGPNDFGLLNYTFATAAIFGVIGKLGLEGIVVRDLTLHPNDQHTILGTTFALKLITYCAATLGLWVFAIYSTPDVRERNLLQVAAFTLLLTPITVTNYWFHAQVKARYLATANITSNAASGLAKIAAAFSALPIMAFALANLLQAVIASFLGFILYVRNGGPSVLRWNFSSSVARRLLSEGWAIFLAGMLGAIYLKVDVVMLKWLSSTEAVGIYSVATRFSEATYFIPGAIVASVFPSLIALRKTDAQNFNSKLQVIFDLMVGTAAAVIAATLIGAYVAIPLLFGDSYADAWQILLIHVLATPFIFLRTVFTRWIIIERAPTFLLVTDGVGAGLNIALNFLLIPSFGGFGAALATLCSYAVAAYVSLSFSRRTRPIFYMMSRSLFLPWRAYGSAMQLLSQRSR
jgi:O-antigen/teichoic acid export membrane protein